MTADDQQRLTVKRIDVVLIALAEPLKAEDVAGGWTPEKQEKWRRWFESLRRKAVDRVPLMNEMMVARGMDYDGICGGHLLDLACEAVALLVKTD